MTREWRKGQVVPYEPPKSIVGDPCDPAWYVLTTPPQKERAAKAWLEQNGVSEAWYPEVKDWRFVKHAAPGAKMEQDMFGTWRRKVPYMRRVAPGYVFVCFELEPIWFRLFERGQRVVSGVVGVKMLDVMGFDGSYIRRPVSVPLAVPEDKIAAMQEVPQRLDKLKQQVLAEAEALVLAKQPIEGEVARVTDGPFEDFVVDVRTIHRGIASVMIEIMGRESRIQINTKNLERIEHSE